MKKEVSIWSKFPLSVFPLSKLHCIVPFLENHFPNSRKYTAFGADKGITESKQRFLEADPSLYNQVRKADFSVITGQSHRVVLALESKSHRNKGKSNTDLIKLARYMKDTLDSTESDGFQQVKIVGIITSGACASVYIMEHKYDYLYTLFKQDRFYIPLDHHDMFRIVPIFPMLNLIKNIITETIRELSTLKHERNQPVTLKSLKTYHTPTQIPQSRVKRVSLDSSSAKNAKRRLFKK